MIFHDMLPNISGDVNKVACDENHDIQFDELTHVSNDEANHNSNQRQEINYTIAYHSLGWSELALQQNSHVPKLTRNLVGNNRDQYRDYLSGISSGEGDSEGESVKEIMYERSHNIHISSRALSRKIVTAACFLFYLVLGTALYLFNLFFISILFWLFFNIILWFHILLHYPTIYFQLLVALLSIVVLFVTVPMLMLMLMIMIMIVVVDVFMVVETVMMMMIMILF